jgi:hypothetical protein
MKKSTPRLLQGVQIKTSVVAIANVHKLDIS